MSVFKKLSLLIDTPHTWFWQYADDIVSTLKEFAQEVKVFRHTSEIEPGDIMFILSCDRILSTEHLKKHKGNIVIHAGDLPKHKGWAPWTWQIEQGKGSIVLTLFEAIEELDSGGWYLKKKVHFSGYELIDDIREMLASTESEMIREYLSKYPIQEKPQEGEETYFRRRTPADQKLDPEKSISSQFNALRVCDNERYPAHFFIGDRKYIIKIYNG